MTEKQGGVGGWGGKITHRTQDTKFKFSNFPSLSLDLSLGFIQTPMYFYPIYLRRFKGSILQSVERGEGQRGVFGRWF